MEIIDFGSKDGTCVKCHEELGKEEKRRGIPICAKCMTELMEIVHNSITKDDAKEFADDVSNLTDFISSSSRLMGLDDIVVIQVCFNIYMSMVRKMGRDKSSVAKKIFRDAKRFIEVELDRLEDNHNDDNNNPFREAGIDGIFEKMMNSLNDREKDHRRGNVTKDGKNSGDCDGCGNCGSCNEESASDIEGGSGVNKSDGLSGDKDEKSDSDKKDVKSSGKRIKIE